MKKFLDVVLVILAVALVVVWFGSGSTVSTTSPETIADTGDSGGPVPVGRDPREVYAEQFGVEVLDICREAAVDYPDPLVRADLSRILDNIDQGRWHFSASWVVGEELPWVYATADLADDGKPVITFHVYQLLQDYQGVEGVRLIAAPGLFRQAIVATMIHEGFHIEAGHINLPVETWGDVQYNETGAWAYAMERVYLPLWRKYGGAVYFLRGDGAIEGTLRVYLADQQRPEDHLWELFILAQYQGDGETAGLVFDLVPPLLE